MLKSQMSVAADGCTAAQAGLNRVEMKIKLKQLLRIERTQIKVEYRSFGPRFMSAMMVGIVTGAIVAGVLVLIDDNGLLVWTGFQSGVLKGAFNSLPFVLSVYAFSIYTLKSKEPKSWYGDLDAKLTQYEPVDKNAYRRLQQGTRDLGVVSGENLSEWVFAERNTIKLIMKPTVKMNETFLDKKV